MNWDRQLIWLVATVIGYVALLFPMFRRRRSQIVAVYLILYVLTSMLWAVVRGVSDWHVVDDLWRAYARQGMVYGLVVLSSLLGMLTTVFLRQETKWAWIWLAVGGVFVVAMGALDWTSVEWPWWSIVSDLSLSTSLALVAWVGLCGTAYFFSWRAFRQTRRPLHRNRLRYWLLVLVLILSGDMLFISFGFPYDELGTMLHWSGTALAIIALLSHHLPDLSGIARHAVRYFLLTLLTALIFFGSVFGAQYASQHIMIQHNMLVTVAAIALLLAILYPLLRQWMQQLLNKFLFGEGYDRDRILREYSQSISNILDLNVLVTVAIGIISEAMEIDRGALLVCDEMPEFRLRPVIGMGVLNVEPISLSRESPPVARMLETGMPLLQYDLDLLPQFQSLLPEERAWFSSLDVEVYVPVRAQDQLLGIFILGAKKSGEPYSSRDIALLRTLAGQTAIALENARLVDDLKRLNTEITQLNQDLTETNERLAIIDRTKSDFISIASHELKTPLTHIRGYTDMLLELAGSGTITPATVRSTTQGISKGALRLQSVVDAMLDVSLIETEAFAVHPIPISLGRTIERVIDGLQDAIHERMQSVVMTGLDLLPDIVADDTRLHQAFRNIIQNSIKYTPDGGKIFVDARVDGQGQQVYISIRDTGIGIDAEHHDLIFEKFYRVGDLNLHSTGQTKFKGAGPGLGLPIARGIIEAHGGRVWVESKGCDEERLPGSTFHIMLPINGPSAAKAEVMI
ncbi:MAG: GAF domain-containing protein [Anaerolineae bacterium]|nr:GAF domain-containing protein [Anaerolineae bacterium]